MYKFILPPLPYSFDALEPYIDAKTMELHHDGHHKAYVDNLNAVLEKHTDLQNKSLEWLLTNLDKIADLETRTAIRNNGGGDLNHTFFWKIMRTPLNNKIKGNAVEVIKTEFGSFEQFQEKFNMAAKKVFGSGWAWLCIDQNGRLLITSTANQDSPITLGFKPILGLDVWENAYYLKYTNKRPDYISAWWNVINWEQVEENYERIIK